MDIDNYTDLFKTTKQWVFVEFYANWCKPCESVDSFISQLTNKWQNVSIYRANIDKVPDFSMQCSVLALPTFILFKKIDDELKIIDKFMGTNPEKILNLLKLTNRQD
jgi:thioredoxin 1